MGYYSATKYDIMKFAENGGPKKNHSILSISGLEKINLWTISVKSTITKLQLSESRYRVRSRGYREISLD